MWGPHRVRRARGTRRAKKWAYYDGEQSLDPVLAQLGIPTGRPVLILVGGAAADVSPQVKDARRLLIEQVIVPTCHDEGAIIITGGTDAGVMAEVGRAAADLAPDLNLLGVAPYGKLRGFGARMDDATAADPEPNHTLLVTPGDTWGDESRTLVRVAERLSADRIVMIAIGGGTGTATEIALAVERTWPLILVTGCHGSSEELADRLRRPGVASASSLVDGRRVDLEELRRADGDGRVLVAEVRKRRLLERDLRWSLSGDGLLREAWSRFVVADRLSKELKPKAKRGAGAVLSLAVATVVVSLALSWSGLLEGSPFWWVLKSAATILPLVAATILGLMERSMRIGSWVDLRAAAESLLREIYRVRAHVPPYHDANLARALFAESLKQFDDKTGGRIAKDVGQTTSHVWSPQELHPRVPLVDTLLSRLRPSAYDEARAVDQLKFLSRAAQEAGDEALRWTLAIYVFAAVSVFFMAVSWRESWASAVLGISATVLAAFLSWREYQQWDARAASFRSAVLAIRAARAQWLSHPVATRESLETLTWYVESVEMALAVENADWDRALRQAQRGFFDRYRGN